MAAVRVVASQDLLLVLLLYMILWDNDLLTSSAGFRLHVVILSIAYVSVLESYIESHALIYIMCIVNPVLYFRRIVPN